MSFGGTTDTDILIQAVSVFYDIVSVGAVLSFLGGIRVPSYMVHTYDLSQWSMVFWLLILL
jgi:hypothetical protein